MLKIYLKWICIYLIFLLPIQTFANENTIPFDSSINWDPYLTANECNQSKELTTSSEKNALWHHVQFFADQNGKLTKKTMKTPHDLLGIYKNVKYKIKAIFNMLERRKLQYTTDNLVTVYNPASTGLWDANGEFDERKFQQLSEFAIEDNGKKIITKQIFIRFLNSLPRDGREKEVAATVTIIWPIKVNITWEQVTKGSVDELFGYLTSYKYKHNGKTQHAFRLEDLKMFYQYPDKYMQKIIDNKHNAIKYQLSSCPFQVGR